MILMLSRPVVETRNCFVRLVKWKIPQLNYEVIALFNAKSKSEILLFEARNCSVRFVKSRISQLNSEAILLFMTKSKPRNVSV